MGKTEVAKTLASILGTELIRLQCYEGLDVSTAVYEWSYARQMMRIRLMEARGHTAEFEEEELFGPEFLVKRPLLQAVTYPGPGRPCSLSTNLTAPTRSSRRSARIALRLPDNGARGGNFRPTEPPAVIITTNRTREIHDALKRRCLYHWIEYPGFEKEIAVVNARLPETPGALARLLLVWGSSCKHWTSTSRPARPKRSTGRRHFSPSNSRPSPSRWPATHSGRSSSTRRT